MAQISGYRTIPPSIPAILRGDWERVHRNSFIVKVVGLGASGDAAYIALRRFLIVNPARFLRKSPTHVFAVRQDIVDDLRGVNRPAFLCTYGTGLRWRRRLGLQLPDLRRRQLFNMHAATDRTGEQAATLLRSKVVARGEPTFEAMLFPADEFKYDHTCVPDSILAHIDEGEIGNRYAAAADEIETLTKALPYGSA